MLFDNDPQVISMAYEYVIVESIIFFAFITIFISNSTLQGIKEPFIIPYVSLYRQLLMPTIFLYILVNIFNVEILYVWICMAIIIYSAAIWIYIYTQRKLVLLSKRRKGI